MQLSGLAKYLMACWSVLGSFFMPQWYRSCPDESSIFLPLSKHPGGHTSKIPPCLKEEHHEHQPRCPPSLQEAPSLPVSFRRRQSLPHHPLVRLPVLRRARQNRRRTPRSRRPRLHPYRRPPPLHLPRVHQPVPLAAPPPSRS